MCRHQLNKKKTQATTAEKKRVPPHKLAHTQAEKEGGKQKRPAKARSYAWERYVTRPPRYGSSCASPVDRAGCQGDPGHYRETTRIAPSSWNFPARQKTMSLRERERERESGLRLLSMQSVRAQHLTFLIYAGMLVGVTFRSSASPMAPGGCASYRAAALGTEKGLPTHTYTRAQNTGSRDLCTCSVLYASPPAVLALHRN